MASSISAGNATNGVIVSSDNTGALNLITGSGSGTTAVTIDSSQNVGVGTTTPTYKMTINNNGAQVLLNNSGAGQFTTIDYANSGTVKANAYWDQTNTYFVFGTDASAPVLFKTVASERMRIDTSGNLNLGTAATTTNARLNVTNGTQQFQFGSTIGPSSAFSIFFNLGGANGVGSQTSASTGVSHYQFYNPNGAVGSIVTNGSGTTYNTSSDYRLKENVLPMTGALATVAQLKPVTYTWKADGSDGQGFIAHELQEVVPDCVTGEKDAMNEDGSIKPQAIDTSFLVATLTAAIQELKAELDALKAKVGE
jgi:hypothetical protein